MRRVGWVVALGTIAACRGSGGPVDGPEDTHCDGVEPTVIDPATCALRHGEEDVYGDTLYGTEGDDDQCKYHVSWSVGDVRRDRDVDFDLHVTVLATDEPAEGAAPNIEAFLDETHPAPAVGASSEEGGGHYGISGVQFDDKGRWTVRFHLYEGCADGDTSPHGHLAFYLDVP